MGGRRKYFPDMMDSALWSSLLGADPLSNRDESPPPRTQFWLARRLGAGVDRVAGDARVALVHDVG